MHATAARDGPIEASIGTSSRVDRRCPPSASVLACLMAAEGVQGVEGKDLLRELVHDQSS